MRGQHGVVSWHVPTLLAVLGVAGAATYLIARQPPVGSIRGEVLAEDTGAPLPGALVYLTPRFPVREGESGTVALKARSDGAFGPRRVVAGTYRVSAYAEAHRLEAAEVTIADGRTKAVALELPREPSRLNIYVHQHVCTADEPVTVLCEGLLQDDQLGVSIYATDLVDLMRSGNGWLYSWVNEARRRSPEGLAGSSHFKRVSQTQVPVTGRDVEGVFQQHLRLPLPGPGLYVLTITADGIRDDDWVLVTDLGLITKQYGEQVLAYATNVRSGAPMAGTEVTAYRGGALVGRGVANADGLAQLSLAPGRESTSLLILGRHEASLATIDTWYSPPHSRDFVVYVYTDRPVYRPGHVVQFKGIVRRAKGDAYEVPANEPVVVEVHDDQDTLLYREELRTNEYGSFASELKLASTAGPGRYSVVTTVRGQHYSSAFFVAEYRKPEYDVTVRSNRERYVRGETAEVTVAAEYYFGEPVAGARVEYWVYRAPYWFLPNGEAEEDYGGDEYEEEDYGGEGELVEHGETKTGNDGRATIHVTTRGDEDEEADHDWQYTVETWVSTPGAESVSPSGKFIVTQGEFALALTTDRWSVRPGEPTRLQVLAEDYDHKAQADVAVRVTLERRTWKGNEVQVAEESRQEVRTDAQGRAEASLTPREQGSYIIKAVARDSRGNRIIGTDCLWVWSGGYADFAYKYPELEIITDKRVYDVGDTVSALINTQADGATALVSIEGKGLRSWFLTRLKAKSTVLKIPVRPEYIPNVYLAVGFVKDKDFVSRTKRIAVSSKPRTLTVELKPNKEEYQPGEPVTYEITTLSPEGKPTAAEVSVGVVDESIYGVRKESGPGIVDAFYARRPNDVETDYSFPRIYLGSGDKEGAAIRVRTRFPDTAFWRPFVRTDSHGKARVSFEMPDTLTTWRATAQACTLDTLVGRAVEKVVCRKDFMARLNTPRFLVEGDEATLVGMVHNRTSGAVQVQATLAPAGLDVLRAPRLGFDVGADGTHQLDWLVRATATGGQRLTLSAQAKSGLSDALETTLPVIPCARERVEWRAGATHPAAREKLFIREDAVPGTARVELLLSPSITSSVWDALDYLATYPWGCTEQTMSAFLPDVLIAKALKDVGLRQPQLEEKLPDMVQAGLVKLYGFQHDDGGWGWWRYDESTPWMTGYVMFGLVQARDAGFPVNGRVFGAGLELLKVQAAVKRIGDRDRAFAAYVLALAGQADLARAAVAKIEQDANRLSPSTLALATLTRVSLGDRAEAEKLYVLLWRKANQLDSLCYWRGTERSGEPLSDTEATALALKASLQVRPDDDRLLKVVQWLMTQREGPHWISTRDTAWILYAVADFVRVSRELAPDFTVSVSLNGKPLGERMRFGPEAIVAPQRRIEIGPESLRRGENFLELTKAGQGNLYYSLRLSQYVGKESLLATITSSGVRVDRSYYRLSPQRDRKTGTIQVKPGRRPQTRFRTGDLMRVTLTLTCPTRMDYVIVEDPRPAGCEVLSRGDLYPWEWSYWYSDVDIRDRSVAFFAREIPPGRHEITYDARAAQPGLFHALPTEAYCMYRPEVRGSGPAAVIEVRK